MKGLQFCIIDENCLRTVEALIKDDPDERLPAPFLMPLFFSSFFFFPWSLSLYISMHINPQPRTTFFPIFFCLIFRMVVKEGFHFWRVLFCTLASQSLLWIYCDLVLAVSAHVVLHTEHQWQKNLSVFRVFVLSVLSSNISGRKIWVSLGSLFGVAEESECL